MNNPKAAYQQQRSFFQLLVEGLFWLQIVASPLLAGLILGCLVYLAQPGPVGIIIGVASCTIGLSIGIVWATRLWKKKGAVHFMSRLIASPELDKKLEEQDDILV